MKFCQEAKGTEGELRWGKEAYRGERWATGLDVVGAGEGDEERRRTGAKYSKKDWPYLYPALLFKLRVTTNHPPQFLILFIITYPHALASDSRPPRLRRLHFTHGARIGANHDHCPE